MPEIDKISLEWLLNISWKNMSNFYFFSSFIKVPQSDTTLRCPFYANVTSQEACEIVEARIPGFNATT